MGDTTPCVGPSDLRAMVAVMRELGVQACDGIVLGPPPTKLEVLERKADAGEVIDAEELAAERRRQKIAAARQEIRDKVGADLSDEECDRFIKPEAA